MDAVIVFGRKLQRICDKMEHNLSHQILINRNPLFLFRQRQSDAILIVIINISRWLLVELLIRKKYERPASNAKVVFFAQADSNDTFKANSNCARAAAPVVACVLRSLCSYVGSMGILLARAALYPIW